MKRLLAALVAIIGIGCTVFTLRFFFSDPMFGLRLAASRFGENSPSAFIMKRAFGDGEAAPTVLVFGYVDNPGTCVEMLKDHYVKYPQTPTGAFYCQNVK